MNAKRTEDMTVAETFDAIFGEGTAESMLSPEDLAIARQPFDPMGIGGLTWADLTDHEKLRLLNGFTRCMRAIRHDGGSLEMDGREMSWNLVWPEDLEDVVSVEQAKGWGKYTHTVTFARPVHVSKVYFVR